MRKLYFISVMALPMILAACTSHYQLADVSRTRILIDSRYDAQPDAAAAAFLSPYKQQVDSVMGPVVGYVAHNMTAFRPESDLSNFLTDVLMYMAKDYNEAPDFAVYNMGGIRGSLTKGKVTYGDVLGVAPFENKICFVTLKGKDVQELFSQIAIRGGEGVSKGVQLAITKDGKLASVRLYGKTIDPEANYRIVTIDYLAQGNDGLSAFKKAVNINSPKDDKNNARYVIRDYFQKMMKQGITVDSKVEGRILVVEN
jgi:2',3'-cyclic-nucleotide 2'-phosphodiesterase (5'-nucleotidase family)